MDAFEKRALRASSYGRYIAHFAISAFGLITGPLLIKALTQEDYGSYQIIASLNSVIVYFTSFGLASVFIRFIPEFLQTRQVGNLVRLTLWGVLIRIVALGLALGVAFGLSAFVFDYFKFTPFLRRYYVAVLVYVFLSKTDSIVGDMVLGAYLEQLPVSIVQTMQAAVRLGIVLLAVLGGGGLRVILFGMIALEGATVLLYAWLSTSLTIRKVAGLTEPSTSAFPLRRVVRFGAYAFFLSATGVFLEVTIDNFVISHFLGVSEVAQYAFAYTILGMAASLNPVPMLDSLISHVVVRRHVGGDAGVFQRVHRLTTTLTLTFLFPALVFVCIFRQDVVRLLNREYESAMPLLLLLSPFVIARALSYPYAFILNALERVEFRFYGCAFAIYNLVADIVLIQWMGLRGIPIATASAAVLTTLFYHFVVTRVLGVQVRYYDRGLLRIAINTAGALAAAMGAGFACRGSIWWSAGAFAIVYGVLTMCFKPLHAEDEATVRMMVLGVGGHPAV